MTGQTTQEIIKETEDIESMLQKSEQRATTGSNWKPVNDRITKDILFHEPVSLPQNNNLVLGAEVHFKKYCMKRHIRLLMTCSALYLFITQSPGVESNASSSVSLPKPVTNGIGAKEFGNIGQRPRRGILTI